MTGLIIDDDPLMVQTVDHFSGKSELVETCRHAEDAASALNLLAGQPFDFVLLDLHLPDLPGQAVLKEVPATVPVIVVSSDPSFGAASYQFANIVDYLVKPIDYARFHHALKRAAQFRAEEGAATPEGSREVIFVKSGSEIVRLVLAEIRFVKADANYVSFSFGPDRRPVMTLASLKHIAGELPGNFLQVHRSYIVNRDHIERVDRQTVHVGETLISIGDSYRSRFLEKLGIIA